MSKLNTEELAIHKRDVAKELFATAVTSGKNLLNSVVHAKLLKDYGSTISTNIMAEIRRDSGIDKLPGAPAKPPIRRAKTVSPAAKVTVHKLQLVEDKKVGPSPQKRAAATRKANKARAAAILANHIAKKDISDTIKTLLGYQPGSVSVTLRADGQLYCAVPRRSIKL
jgi:hypothetical protein